MYARTPPIALPAVLTLALLAITLMAVFPMAGSSAAQPRLDYVVTVEASARGGLLKAYGATTIYARLQASFDPSGRLAGSVYILDLYPSYILATPAGSYLKAEVLGGALRILGEAIANPPGASGGWERLQTGWEGVFVVAGAQGQEVYKCRAGAWRLGDVEAYAPGNGGPPLRVRATMQGPAFAAIVDAKLVLVYNAKPPCGSPATSRGVKDALGAASIAVIAAALVAYARRPRFRRILVLIPARTWP